MLIKNKTLSIISLPGDDGQPHGRLMPGVNEVDPREWKKAESSMAIHLENDRLEVVDVKVADLEEPPEENEPVGDVVPTAGLAQLGQKKALPLIAATVDRELLKKWELEEHAGNKRPKVLAALADQLKKVTIADDAAAAAEDDELEGDEEPAAS